MVYEWLNQSPAPVRVPTSNLGVARAPVVVGNVRIFGALLRVLLFP